MKKGLTLVEVIISSAILAALLISLLGIYNWCFSVQEKCNNRNIAFTQMQAILERIKSEPNFADILNYNNKPPQPLSGLNGEVLIRVEQGKKSAGAGGGLEPALLDITLIAGWVERGGRIVGDGALDASGTFRFTGANPSSSFELKTSIANKK